MSKLITAETRKESYLDIQKSIGLRSKQILEVLNSNETPLTAKEIAVILFEQGAINSPERNATHPRLNELVAKNLVAVKAKKTCSYTNKRVATYLIVTNYIESE